MDAQQATGAAKSSGSRRSSLILPLILAIAAISPVVLWPETAWWLIDEPRLLANAWHANNDGRPATHGLTGNFRVMYGPMPTHVYQLLLTITHDPGLLVIMRALLLGSVTAGSLLWLARSAGLPAWFAAALLAAPLVTLFHRVMWDASFTIPLGTLALAAFAAFLRTGGKWPLRITLAAGFLTSIIHPQALPVFIPIAALLAWRHRPALRADRRGLFWTAMPILALNGAYLCLLFGNIVWLVTMAPPTSYPGDGSRLESAFAPLLGARLLTGWGIQPPFPEWTGTALQWLSLLIYPLTWLGIVAACLRAPAVFRKKDGVPEPLDVLCVAALAGLLLLVAMFVAGRIPWQPQYFFGTFPLYAFFAMLGVRVLDRWRLGLPAGVAFGAASAAITTGWMWASEHRRDDPPGWPSIRDAREVVESLNRHADVPVFTDIALLDKYPQAIRAMRLLIPREPQAARRRADALLITYATRDGSAVSRMIVRELPADGIPKSALPFDADPLPPDWVPPENKW